MRIAKDVTTLLTGIICAGAVTLLITVLVTLGVSVNNHAEAAVYYPDDNTIIASWERPSDALPDVQTLQQELAQARTLNGSEKVLRKLYRQTQRGLNAQIANPEWHIFHARLLQQQHQFDEAAEVLDNTIRQHRASASALMLLATVEVNRGSPDQARKACQKLAGIGEPTFAAICLLDIDAQQQPDEADYQKLQQLRKFSGLERAPAIDNWAGEILAAMAMALNKPEEAAGYLSDTDLSAAPISRVALWADIQLELGRASAVTDILTPLIKAPSNLDDAILVRLAQAEATLATNDDWQQILKQRVTMREWRGDNVHAAQLARYYLDVNADPVKAMHFAKLNWEHGKTWDDKMLLQRANALELRQ